MLRSSILLSIFALLIAGGWAASRELSQVPQLDGRIVGGEGTHISQYPHQISMRYNGRHRCGGSVYSKTIIVSAAHCVVGSVAAKDLTILAGITMLSEKMYGIQVMKIIVHPKYRSLNNDYDVAILVLRDPLEFSDLVQPIPLATERPPSGSEVTVSGWGTLVEGGNIPDQLQKVDVNIVDNADCKKAYTLTLTSRMLCANVEGGGKDACQGDSGGPLIYKNTLLGVVSWGTGCARPKFPGVYASVPELAPWIVETATKNTFEFANLPSL